MTKYKNEKFESLKSLFPHGVKNLSEAKEYVSSVHKTVENGIRSAGKVKHANRILRDVGIGAIVGVAGERISESYQRVVSSIPGGSIVVDYGFPNAVRRIISTYPTNPQTFVTENINNALSNGIFYGALAVLIAEGTYFGVKGIKHAQNWYKERKQKESTIKQ